MASVRARGFLSQIWHDGDHAYRLDYRISFGTTGLCVTVDGDTLENQTVTVRDRDTMAQEHVSMDKIKGYLRDKMDL